LQRCRCSGQRSQDQHCLSNGERPTLIETLFTQVSFYFLTSVSRFLPIRDWDRNPPIDFH
jgi:hypothetical protein